MALNAKTFMLERVSTAGTRLPEEKSFHFAVTHLRITNLAKWQQARAREWTFLWICERRTSPVCQSG
jgi:hypothetical protein